MKKLLSATIVLLTMIFLSGYSFAQDATKADPKHYKVEFENDQVRVLRITYGAGEKSVMHEHSDAVAIMLTDMKGVFNFPDNKKTEVEGKAGSVLWTPAVKHLPENTSDKPYEVILVELKNKQKTKDKE